VVTAVLEILLCVLQSLWHVSSCLNRREEIKDEAESPERIDKGNDPLEDCGNVIMIGKRTGSEYDGENEFDDDEEQLDPERDPQNAVLTVVDSEALVFSTEEDRANDVASDKQQEEGVMEVRMTVGIEDAEQDDTGSASGGEHRGEN
jgi:hypothetical protein